MRKLAFIVLGAIAVSAQASDPIVAHYRAYNAAVQAGDLALAEREAQSAWEASVSRDQDGGRSGVLALNLATIRLSNGQRAEAYAPALQAFNIAAHGHDAALDPLLTRLILGRAELTEERADVGRARLATALLEAAGRAEVGREAYLAAVELGHWETAHEHLVEAAAAWSVVQRYAAWSPGDQALALGESQMLEGVARVSLAAQVERRNTPVGGQNLGAMPRRPLFSATPDADPAAEYQRAATVLSEAERNLLPLTQTRREDGVLTEAQRSFAFARAWRQLIRVRLMSRRQEGVGPIGEGAALPHVCPLQLLAEPAPEYPVGAASNDMVGVVVLRASVNANGQLEDLRVAAAVPEERFRETVERVSPQWRVRRAPGTPENCDMRQVAFPVVNFALRP